MYRHSTLKVLVFTSDLNSKLEQMILVVDILTQILLIF